MQGLMSSYPLTLPHLFHRAERLFGSRTITTLTATGKERTTSPPCAVATPFSLNNRSARRKTWVSVRGYDDISPCMRLSFLFV